MSAAKTIYSMTGYGRGQAAGARFRVTAELRSVNGRFLEIRLKLPRMLSFLEPKARQLVEKQLQRGVVDVSLQVQPLGGAVEANLNLPLAKAYAAMATEIARATGVPDGLHAVGLLKLPGVVGGEDASLLEQDEEIPALAAAALTEALTQLLSMRASEGAKLALVIERELAELVTHRAWIHGHREELNAKYFTKLQARVQDWLGKAKGGVDESRLHQEVAFYLDRSDVTEEIDRLGSHLKQCEDALSGISNKSVGKRLEFLAQELGREVNTIGAKSDQLPVTNLVLE
ncbi:MAG: YicC family protein, partial [Proteobacteria bacterium]